MTRKSGAKAPDRDRGREQPRPPEGRPTKRQQRQVPRSTTRNSTAASTPSARPQRPPTSQPPAQPQRQAQDCPIPAQRPNQAHSRPSLLPAQLHRHPLLLQHAAIRLDHIQIVDRPSRYCVCDSFAARAADSTAASCARVWSARIRRFARLSSTSRNAFSTVCRYSATSSSYTARARSRAWRRPPSKIGIDSAAPTSGPSRNVRLDHWNRLPSSDDS